MPANHPQATSSHMMKTTKRGRPFLKDTLDLFATMITSMELTTHKQYFKSFPNSFTTDDACEALSCLKFSQSNRSADPRDPDRIITTTTTTTFSMTRDMAKAMSQHFMDARLIENAIDKSSNQFKDRSVYQLTPKGLHVLERFISKNGVNADDLIKVFQSQPICMKLLHLERRSSDDEIIISQQVVTALFRRFAGRAPNYMEEVDNQDPAVEYNQRSAGIPLNDVVERAPQLIGKGPLQTFKHCFLAVNALEWLCDFTSIVGRDEAAEMAAHFVRFGLITLLSDKRKSSDSAVIFTVRGTVNGPNSAVAAQGEFRCTAKAIYRITDEGRKVARWNETRPAHTGRDSPVGSGGSRPGSDRVSTDTSEAPRATELAYGPGAGAAQPSTLEHATDHQIHRRMSMEEKMKADHASGEKSGVQKESNTDRLKFILDEPALRSLFREFLRGNFCEENLSFWLEVQEFKRKFLITSTAMSTSRSGNTKQQNQHAAMEKHHEKLINMAFMIYNTYLAPSSHCELNIDHGLRNDLVAYLNEVMTESTGKAFQGRVDPEQAHSLNATQLQHIIRLYERIQLHVFRLMATDSVPKFIKTKRFLALRNWVEDYEAGENDQYFTANGLSVSGPAGPPGLEDEGEVGGAYITISQQANEKAAAAAKEKLQRQTYGDI